MGLKQFELTRDEAALAKETPEIMWETFSRTFGDSWRKEWPNGHKIPGYKTFFCAGLVVQPFVPINPGKPGVVIHPPATVGTVQNDNQSFNVFSSTVDNPNLLRYLGKYTRVDLPQVKIKWCDLPREVRMSKFSR